jgi:hypothetical protein
MFGEEPAPTNPRGRLLKSATHPIDPEETLTRWLQNGSYAADTVIQRQVRALAGSPTRAILGTIGS